MNPICSTVDSINPDCLPGSADSTDRQVANPRLELPVSIQRDGELAKASLFRPAFRKLLDGIKTDALTVNDSDGRHVCGPKEQSVDSLHANVVVADQAAYRRIVLGSTLGAAESYIDGQWGSDDLTSLIRIMIRNLSVIQRVDRTWSRAKNVWSWGLHLTRRNTVSGSRRNIHEHYDLGNDFYKLFLDPTLSYSSAIFDSVRSERDSEADNTLYDASIRKMEVVREKLNVAASDHVLEIGTGWGGMAIHLSSTTGCKVTTTTISKEQYHHAIQRVENAGLSDQITVLQKDYRELDGCYDKIVSIEMIEAVGHQYFDRFFTTCSQLLKPKGKMLLQSILIAGQQYHRYIRQTDFIRRYVFPGGCLPSIAAVQRSIDKVTDFQMIALDDYSEDYATTLMLWRKAFMSQLHEVRSLGYDEKFIRLWHFYLCYCEAAFRERRTNLAQIVFEKPAVYQH